MSPRPMPVQDIFLEPRQIWAAETTDAPNGSECYAFRIHGPGYLILNDSSTIELTGDAVLQPQCANGTVPVNETILDNALLDIRDPYFASTSPVAFVLAVCLTVAWVLLIMLLISPRTFVVGAPGATRGILGAGNSQGGVPVAVVGDRPWLQKIATLTVAVSLLIATIYTFQVAEYQYAMGYQDSLELTYETMGSLQVRIIRFVSTLFEWLAQAQTCLRLFQRHREKVAIKWVSLALIGMEMIFGIINNFTALGQDAHFRPRHYVNAIPALQYLFEMALSLLYAAVVVYYSMTKRRFAYYHSAMKNISLVALLALTAVLIPAVFFVLDIAMQNVAAWGDYVRWVGAAAASVIVWEWVERIEALERDERREGILGREIFESDEMLGGLDGLDGIYDRRWKRRQAVKHSESAIGASSSRSEGGGSTVSSAKKLQIAPGVRYARLNKEFSRRITALRRLASRPKGKKADLQAIALKQTNLAAQQQPKHQTARKAPATATAPRGAANALQPPRRIPSPPSRTETSTASTLYRVVHHPVSPSSTPGISEALYPTGATMNTATPEPVDMSGHNSHGLQSNSANSANLISFRRKPSIQVAPPAPETSLTPSELERLDDVQTSSLPRFWSRFRRKALLEEDLPPIHIDGTGDVPIASFNPESAAEEDARGSLRGEGVHGASLTLYYENMLESDRCRSEASPRHAHNGTQPDD